jgi:hypothetical protein
LFIPQAITDPFDNNTYADADVRERLLDPPAAICVTPEVNPNTCVGFVRVASVPSPI